jgi:hypothetical protein
MWWRLGIGLTLTVASFGQAIHLKTRTIDTPDPEVTPFVGHAMASDTAHVHKIIQFDHAPVQADLDALVSDGIEPVAALPDNAVVVAAPGGWLPLRAGERWIGIFEATDKLSPDLRLGGDGVVRVMVEFHPELSAGEQETIAGNEGVTLERTPPLLPQHAIVEAMPETIRRLAEHDEVAYIFPSGEMDGDDWLTCAGMLTTAGAVGQYANVVHGWDTDPDGWLRLGYFLTALTPKVPAATVQSEILRALNEWAKHAKIAFSAGTTAGAAHSVMVKFASGSHGDSYSFDGRGGVVAHTFYPVPVNAEPIAGDIHLDADENWHAGGDLDIYSVVLHEAGHALGLGHSDKPGDVMYPYYRRGAVLSANDIGALQTLYGLAGEGPVSSPVTMNPPGVPALSLALDPAASPSANPTIAMTGRMVGGSAPYVVTWQTDHGAAGRAVTSGGQFTSPGVPLVSGENLITITAFDAAGRTATKTAGVSYLAATSSPPKAGSAPVTIRVATPSSGIVSTSAASLVVTGTAGGGAGISKVTWQTSNGASGTASGTSQWTAAGIPLLTGTTTIILRAWDAANAMAWASVVAVKR